MAVRAGKYVMSDFLQGRYSMDTNRKIAIAAGTLFLTGTLAGALSVFATKSIPVDANYLATVAANENRITAGALLVLIMGIALSMVPVVLFPILKKQNEILALGAVVFRGVLEAVLYIIIVLKMLFMLILSRAYVQAETPEDSGFQALGNFLQKADVSMATVLGIIFPIGALMLYYLFYRSKLIPHWLSLWGLLGSILYLASFLAGMFGFPLQILMVPLAIQEMIMALWLIVQGFDSNAVSALTAREAL